MGARLGRERLEIAGEHVGAEEGAVPAVDVEKVEDEKCRKCQPPAPAAARESKQRRVDDDGFPPGRCGRRGTRRNKIRHRT